MPPTHKHTHKTSSVAHSNREQGTLQRTLQRKEFWEMQFKLSDVNLLQTHHSSKAFVWTNHFRQIQWEVVSGMEKKQKKKKLDSKLRSTTY